MKTQEERVCKCCNKVIPDGDIKREDMIYCKNCKRHHKTLYAKWRMQEKRGERKKIRLSNRIKESGIDQDIAEKTKRNVEGLFEKEKAERRIERIMDNQKQFSNSSPVYYPPPTRSILDVVIDFFRNKKTKKASS